MLRNPYKWMQDMFASPGVAIGTVTTTDGKVSTVTLSGGGTIPARGDTTLGAVVYVRDGVIEGTANTLPIVVIEV